LNSVNIVVSVVPVVIVAAFWQILRKAGYPGWLSLLALVPVVNIVMLYVFAFSEWPNSPTRTASS
jgi:hypothetical protein